MDLSFLFGGPSEEQQALLRAAALRGGDTAGNARAQLGIPDLHDSTPKVVNTGRPLFDFQPPAYKPGPGATAGDAQRALGMLPDPLQAAGGPQAMPVGPQATPPPPSPQNPPSGAAGPAPGALPKARAHATGAPASSTSGVTNVAAVPPAAPARKPSDDLEDRREQYERELAALQQPVDYTGLQAQAANRREGGRNSLIMALAAQQAGEGFQPFAAQYLKRAAEQSGPMKVEGGIIDESGQVIIDPAFRRQQQMEQTQRRIAAIDGQIAQAQSREEQQAYQRQRDAEMLEFRKQQAIMQHTYQQSMLEMRAEAARDRRALAAGLGGAGGEGIDALPKAATAQEKNDYADASLAVDVLPQLQAQVRQMPHAFGLGVGVPEKIGGALGMSGNDVSPFVPFTKQLTPQEQSVRGQVYQRYATLINKLIGAAQSPTEYQRLQAFVLGQNESAESIAGKIEGAIQEYQTQRSNLRQRYAMDPANKRMDPGLPPSQQAPAPAAGPKPPVPGEVRRGYVFIGGDPGLQTSWRKQP